MISGGQALAKLAEGIRLQGGDERVIEDYGKLPQARLRAEVLSESQGYIAATNCMEFGIALAMLGGGREKKEDKIDHGVGLEFHKRIGDRVEKNEPLVTIFYNSGARLAEACARIAAAVSIAGGPPEGKPPLIRRLLGA
jgi:pyrimidine-nucleoside phosphorylase